MLRFKAYGGATNLQKAKIHLEALLQRYPDKASLQSSLAGIYLAEHRFREAVDMARAAVESADPENRAKLNLRLFDVFWAYGKYEEAEQLLRTNKFNRHSFDFLVREARLADKLGNLEKARGNMVLALRECKAYAQSPVVIAWCHTTLAHFEHHSSNPKAVCIVTSRMNSILIKSLSNAFIRIDWFKVRKKH
ncbi:hypothetical protein GWO09_23365 [candidate division KSB1 bacterium]|nr:hypothetical protein [candidate division KSB1 bacterium]